MVRPTGVLQLVGVNPKGSRLPIDLFDIHFREIRIHGAYGRGPPSVAPSRCCRSWA